MEENESAMKRAKRKYLKKMTEEGRFKQVCLQFALPNNQDIWEHLQKQPNRQGYIKDLIRKDMENGRE